MPISYWLLGSKSKRLKQMVNLDNSVGLKGYIIAY